MSRSLAAKAVSIPWLPFALIGLLWLPALNRFSIEWSINPQYYYGWSVPFLAAFLFYERWGGRPQAIPPTQVFWTAVLILLLALPQFPLRLLGEANSDWRLVSWAMGGTVMGITFAVLYLYGGWKWVGYFAFPIVFVASAIPWPSFVETLLVQGLMRINALLSAEVVSLCGVPAIAKGNVIELPTGVLGVNEACSGIRSMQSTLMAALFLGEFHRLRWVGRVLLVAAGIGIAFVCNLARTIFLSWQGAFHGIEATEKWHDTAGFAILGVVLVCLWLISGFLEKRAERDGRHYPKYPANQ
jgi:exosortase